MKIILASPRGFCAGVNMAIETLELAIKLYGPPIYVYHEIVHNKYVVERFRRLDADTILYQFDVNDPTAYVRPWKGEYTMSASPGPIFEYACHEGNYGLQDVLKGARAQEKAAAAVK